MKNRSTNDIDHPRFCNRMSNRVAGFPFWTNKIVVPQTETIQLLILISYRMNEEISNEES